jgi:hypothetical protein
VAHLWRRVDTGEWLPIALGGEGCALAAAIFPSARGGVGIDGGPTAVVRRSAAASGDTWVLVSAVDAVGSTRGHAVTRVDDRVLTSFMTELDGLARGNTRAWTRAHLLRLAGPARVDEVDWDLVGLTAGSWRPFRGAGRQTVDLPCPFGATKADNEGLFSRGRSLEEIVEQLQAERVAVAATVVPDGTRAGAGGGCIRLEDG